MNQFELQNAKKIIEYFEQLQEEFNSKYEDLEIEIDNDGDLKIMKDYFSYEKIIKLEQIIIHYKKIIKG